VRRDEWNWIAPEKDKSETEGDKKEVSEEELFFLSTFENASASEESEGKRIKDKSSFFLFEKKHEINRKDEGLRDESLSECISVDGFSSLLSIHRPPSLK